MKKYKDQLKNLFYKLKQELICDNYSENIQKIEIFW